MNLLPHPNAFQIANQNSTFLSTGLKRIDDLSKGLQRGNITEFCGESNSFKTQVALYSAATCLLSDPISHVIYISSSAYFPLDRFSKIVSNHPLFNNNIDVINRLQVLHIYTYYDLSAFFESFNQVANLIIIDSIAALLYPIAGTGYSDINSLGLLIKKVAYTNCIPVLSINFIVTVGNQVYSSLGKTWRQFPKVQILFTRLESGQVDLKII